jgi:hypothetical protein
MASARSPLRLGGFGPWVLLGAVLGCLLLSAVLLGVRLSAGGIPAGAPALTVIPRPTVTTTPTASPTLLPTAQATDQPPGTPSGGTVAKGMLVEVVGTGADGLRLRVAPGLQSATNLVAVENEVFEVRDGPSQADGRTWWYLVNPYDNDKYGWGVQEYLQPAGG